jgi:hypothetical protein
MGTGVCVEELARALYLGEALGSLGFSGGNRGPEVGGRGLRLRVERLGVSGIISALIGSMLSD